MEDQCEPPALQLSSKFAVIVIPKEVSQLASVAKLPDRLLMLTGRIYKHIASPEVWLYECSSDNINYELWCYIQYVDSLYYLRHYDPWNGAHTEGVGDYTSLNKCQVSILGATHGFAM